MDIIFVRSPFFINIDDNPRIGSRVELKFRTKSTSYPTAPSYTISKPRVTINSVSERYNISDYAREYININQPSAVVNGIESDDLWCFVEVKRYVQTDINTFDLIDTTEYIALNGYSQDSVDSDLVLLFNPAINKQFNQVNTTYLNILINYQGDNVNWNGLNILRSPDPLGYYLIKVRLAVTGENTLTYFDGEVGLSASGGLSTQVCEPKYSPIIVWFINRFGGWQSLTFFKNKVETIETESKEYHFLGGNKKAFNFQGTESIRANTGYVDENYNELIQDLLLSENVLIGDRKVLVKSKSQPKKTSLNDKLINFELEFIYSDNLINDVI
jgi:hypothetical protein